MADYSADFSDYWALNTAIRIFPSPSAKMEVEESGKKMRLTWPGNLIYS